MVRLRRRSRTATFPRLTVVSVPSQRSAVTQTVPLTVAAEWRARVRKRPLAVALRRRIVRRESCAAFAPPTAAPPRARQRLKPEPFSRSSVSPFCARARDCSTWKSPALKRPDCVFEPVPVALTSSTVPRLVSRNEPTGTCRSAVSGTNSSPFWAARVPAARAAPDGTATSTVPFTTSTFTADPNTGGATEALPRGPQSMPMSVSTFSWVSPEPSTPTVQSSSWIVLPTSLMKPILVPSGDHASSQTSPSPGTSGPSFDPSGLIAQIPPFGPGGPRVYAIREPSGAQDGPPRLPGAVGFSWVGPGVPPAPIV